jgi:hypothetical protein
VSIQADLLVTKDRDGTRYNFERGEYTDVGLMSARVGATYSPSSDKTICLGP